MKQYLANLIKCVALLAIMCLTFSVDAQVIHQSEHLNTWLSSATVQTVTTPAIVDTYQKKKVEKRELRLVLDMGEVYPLGGLDWNADVIVNVEARDQANNLLHLFKIPFQTFDQSTGTGCPEQTEVLDYTVLGNSIHHFNVVVPNGSYSITGINGNIVALAKQHIRLKITATNFVGYGTADFASTPIQIQLGNMSVNGNGLSQTDNRMIEAHFAWTLPHVSQYFESYDLEVVKLEAEGLTAQVPVDWSHAVKIEVEGGKQEYTLTLALGTGYYAWRVRPIGTYFDGKRSNKLNYGRYNIASPDVASGSLTSPAVHYLFTGGAYDIDMSGTPVHNLTPAVMNVDYFHYYQFDEVLNWAYGKSLTEGSKQAESMVFANGLNEVQQAQVKLFSQRSIRTSAAVYDYTGRPSLQVLPAPTGSSRVGYDPDFFNSSSGGTYSAADFDENTNIYTPVAADPANKVNTYYSDANDDAMKDAFVPDANGKPYARTLFNTEGRIYKQSGAGTVMELKPDGAADDHNMRMRYSNPGQIELDRVFGSEAPLANTVQKVTTRDENGVINVTYQTKTGDILATCLDNAGALPNLSEVDFPDGQNFEVCDVLDPGTVTPGSTVSHTSTRLTIEGDNDATPDHKTVTLDYNMTPGMFGNLCDICWTCDYRVEISITNLESPADVDRNATLVFEVAPINLFPSCVYAPGSLDLTALAATTTFTVYDPTGAVSSSPFVGQSMLGVTPFAVELHNGTYLIEKRVYSHNVNTATNQTYLQDRIDELIEQYWNWTATDNCCGPFNIDASGFECPPIPEAPCGSADLANLAAGWYNDIIQKELSHTLTNGAVYTTQLTLPGAPLGSTYPTLASFQTLINDMCAAGYSSTDIGACFAVYGAVLEMNIQFAEQILVANGGNATGPGNGPIQFNDQLDVLQSVFDCLGYPPGSTCSDYKTIVDYTPGQTSTDELAAQASGDYYVSVWHLGQTGGTPIDLVVGVQPPYTAGGKVLYVEIPDPTVAVPVPYTVMNKMCVDASAYPNAATTGMTLVDAQAFLANNLCACVKAQQNAAGNTPPAVDQDIVDVCVQNCEDKRSMFESAIDQFMLEYNVDKGYLTDETDPLTTYSIWADANAPGFDPATDRWFTFLDLFPGQDKACMVDNMVSQCVSQCQLTETLLAATYLAGNGCNCNAALNCFQSPGGNWYNCPEDYLTSTEYAAIVAAEQHDFIEAYTYNALWAPIAGPGTGLPYYSSIPDPEIAEQEVIDFIYESLGKNLRSRPTVTQIGGGATHPMHWFGNPNTYYFTQEVMAITLDVGTTTPIVNVVTNVVWDAQTLTNGAGDPDASDDIISEINFAIYCKGNNSTPLLHWAYSPNQPCGAFSAMNPFGFDVQATIAEIFFDANGAVHAVLRDMACDATDPLVVDVSNVCTNYWEATMELNLGAGTTGDQFWLDLGNNTDGWVDVMDNTVAWTVDATNTAAAIAQEINTTVSDPNFTAEALGGTVIIHTAANAEYDPATILASFNGTLPVTVGVPMTLCSDPLLTLADNSCSQFEVDAMNLECPFGYFRSNTTANYANIPFTLPTDEAAFEADLKQFWSSALTDIIEFRTITPSPQFPVTGYVNGTNDLVYYEQTKSVYINGSPFIAFVTVVGQEADNLKSLVALHIGLSCYGSKGNPEIQYILEGGNGVGGTNASIIWPALTINTLNPGLGFNPLGFPGAIPFIFDDISLAHGLPINGTKDYVHFDLNHLNMVGPWTSGLALSGTGWMSQLPLQGPALGNDPIENLLSGADVCDRPDPCDICMRWEKPEIVIPPTAIHIPTCEELQAAFIANQLQMLLDSCRDTSIVLLETAYSNCLYDLQDELKLRYNLDYGHYTLYYHDRAGNLVKTVPPEGVVPFNLPGDFTLIQAHRDDLTGTVLPHLPQHFMVSTYISNSIQQAVSATTPDGQKSKMWYNIDGQQVLAQDAQMEVDGIWNYMRYDALGRLVESGQISSWIPTYLDAPFNQVIDEAWAHPNFPLNLTGPILSKRQYMQYSVADPTVQYGTQGQQHLRNRLSKGWTDEGFSTWFSYDPHGNVEWLIQELPDIGRKTVRKQYDLVSNNVTKIIYMEGTTEQFMHRFEFDADNRLTNVFTSTDDITWERDASFSFYRNGELARKGLGEDLIQGVDYTNTIHGRLKAINQPELDPSGMKDPGMDGTYVGQLRIEDNNLPGQWINTIKVDGTVTLTNVVVFSADGAVATASDIVQQVNALYDPVTHPYKASNETGSSQVITFYGPQPPSAGAIVVNGVMATTVLSNMSIKNSYIKDEFAIELGYYDGDFSRTNSHIGASLDGGGDPTDHYPFTSNIAGTTVTTAKNSLYNSNIAYWQTNTRAGQGSGAGYNGIDYLKMRLFHYDKLGRLKGSDYTKYDGTQYTAGKNREYDEFFSYDHNGNIIDVTRYGFKEPTPTLLPNCNQSTFLLDQLTYSYDVDGAGDKINRLKRVDEDLTAQNPLTLPKGNWGGDLGTQTGTNYGYDAAGRMVQDVSEGIQIKWNTLHNKPEVVTVSDPTTGNILHTVHYKYDADGSRLIKETRDPSGIALERTYYVGGGSFIYKREYTGSSTIWTMAEASINGNGRLGQYLPNLVLLKAPGYADGLATPIPPVPLKNCVKVPYIAKDGPPKGGGDSTK